MKRLTACFDALRARNRCAFVAFLMAGDPDYGRSLSLAASLPEAGVDVIEIGMPFTDPMADGPSIQHAGLRALKGGQTLEKTLDLVEAIRARCPETPIILMGYYNPVHAMGTARFLQEAGRRGADGLILVDLPPEEDHVVRAPATRNGLALIRLAAPTTDTARLTRVLDGASGFLYYVSVTGVTGAPAPRMGALRTSLACIRARTDLPLCVGFGIRSPDVAAKIARMADGVVVGSAIVERIGAGACTAEILAFVATLGEAIHEARG